ncbi:MAG TPA: D-2-hydroxyacid dehydrogenase [Chloroflexota bacterium]|nr:D-2-hydroxyacid dehydrogenase [Chloroflexota bacterium]
MTLSTINVLIASPFVPELIDRMKRVDPRFEVTYRPDMLGTPRYQGDHFPPFQRTPEQAAEWAALLSQAEVMFDVDQPSQLNFPSRVPKLKWLQTSSSGIGELMHKMGMADSSIQVTNAAGIHAVPLAEFVLFGMLYFAKTWPRLAAEQRAHHWERCTIDTLTGKTLGIVGLGNVGREVARLAHPFGMRVLGVRRTSPDGGEGRPAGSDVDALYGPSGLTTVLRASDYLALCLPQTAETIGLLGDAELRSMKPSAVLINIARGSVVDEAPFIAALQHGRLAGAALDVAAKEPLPADSPLWDMPNVIITPHSMSTAADENERLTTLFCDNLRRYAAGEPLRNRFELARGY